MSQLQKNNNDPQEKQHMQQKYDILRNKLLHSFYRSDTMKTYDGYQNNIGFLGGSIGTNVYEQLTSIAQIFSEAGMEIPPKDL